jgi:integrase
VLRDATGWERATVGFYFSAIRGFLRWAKNGISEDRAIWRLPAGVAHRRRWLTKTQLLDLLHAAPRQARLLVALEGFNGLRRIEVLRLRVQDVNLAENLLNVLGKGRMGGKWRQIPLQRVARDELKTAMEGRGDGDRIIPYSPSGADKLLQNAVEAARFSDHGVKVSHHDLRRSFGRLANAAGMDLIQLKNLYEHASMDMTVHYVGLDMDRMRAGLDQFDQFMGRELPCHEPNQATSLT